MTWEEGFKRAKQNLKEEFDLAEAYSLGKVIINGNKKNSKLASQYLGKWWKRIVIAVYELNKDNEADLEKLSPTTYYHISRKEM
ncbi:6899_t:CDS:1, partial [Paraglomus brasilianum]